jgi:hypothetical protein
LSPFITTSIFHSYNRAQTSGSSGSDGAESECHCLQERKIIFMRNIGLSPEQTQAEPTDSFSHEEHLKRRFLSLCIIGMVFVIAVFGVRDFLELRVVEGGIITGVVVLLITLFFILNRSKAYFGIMRSVALLLIAALMYEFYSGGGNGAAFLWLYMLPTGLVFLLGFREGGVWVGLLTLLLAVLIFGQIGFVYPNDLSFRFIATFSTVGVLSCCLEMIRERYLRQLVSEKESLQKAINEIHELKGLVPICASCKKIRDDKGFWTQIETFMKDRSDLEFSHGICPECAEKLFPGRESGDGKKQF